MTTADVVVVGAGPAGSVTARELARRGHRVVLLDRREFPRAKPCGDCLSPEAARVLDRLGLLDTMRSLASARLDGWRIWSPGGASFAGGFDSAADGDARVRSAIAIRREVFDDALLRAARDAGVELRLSVRVQAIERARGAVTTVVAHTADGGAERFRARLVVGADGLRSVIARRVGATAPAGPLRKLSLTMHRRFPRGFTGALGEMHVVPLGCIGLAPVEAGDAPLHNLTFVSLAAARVSPPELMRRMLHEAPGLTDRLSTLLEAIDAGPPPLASGPFDRPVRFVVADGVALVGDAAGYYDPFTGQGVYQALAGAEQLAAVADDALRANGASVPGVRLHDYARWLRRKQRPARSVQRAIEYVSARPALMNGFTRAIDRAPRFADALVAVTGDLRPARTLTGAPLAALARGFLQLEAMR